VPAVPGGYNIAAHALFRRSTTVRLVPLTSAEASDPRVGETAADRLLLLRELGRRRWALTERPTPACDRSTMPVALTTQAEPKVAVW